MILPKIRDPRFITLRRGGTLTDGDHHLLALWAAPPVQSTSYTSSNRRDRLTRVRARQLDRLVPGCVARHECPRPEKRRERPMPRPEI